MTPLHELLKKNVDFVRDLKPEHDESFGKLRGTLYESPELAHVDGKLPLEFRTDASGLVLGAVLMIEKDG